jgi:hypothetical protein
MFGEQVHGESGLGVELHLGGDTNRGTDPLVGQLLGRDL